MPVILINCANHLLRMEVVGQVPLAPTNHLYLSSSDSENPKSMFGEDFKSLKPNSLVNKDILHLYKIRYEVLFSRPKKSID